MPSEGAGLIDLRWQLPAHVGAAMSSRHGGCSPPPFDDFNLASHCGDSATAVAANRRRFEQANGALPVWLRQVHGSDVVRVRSGDAALGALSADAAWSTEPGVACAVLVADCLPMLLAAPGGVAAAHAGWRGLAAGVLENTVRALCDGTGCAAGELSAWLGPCIGPRRFQVGADVLQALGTSSEARACFVNHGMVDGSPRWLADLGALAQLRLQGAGVWRISVLRRCTVDEASSFFSYRRDGVTGRMAAAVWLRR